MTKKIMKLILRYYAGSSCMNLIMILIYQGTLSSASPQNMVYRSGASKHEDERRRNIISVFIPASSS